MLQLWENSCRSEHSTKFSVMSANTSKFTSTKVNYSLNIEILSIDLKNREDLENFSVEVKFAEKCMEICPEGDSDGLPAVGRQPHKDPSQLKMPRMTTVADASKSVFETSKTLAEDCKSVVDSMKSVAGAGASTTKLYFSPNDADDERSTISEAIRKTQKRGMARETTRVARDDDVCNDSTDESSVNIPRKTKFDATRETKISNSRQSKRETDRETKRETKVPEKLEKLDTTTVKSRATTRPTKAAPESFGSAEEVFEITPNCMSGLLAKHCFKYEVLRDCQLYGEFRVFTG